MTIITATNGYVFELRSRIMVGDNPRLETGSHYQATRASVRKALSSNTAVRVGCRWGNDYRIGSLRYALEATKEAIKIGCMIFTRQNRAKLIAWAKGAK